MSRASGSNREVLVAVCECLKCPGSGRGAGWEVSTSQWQKTCNLVTVQPDNHLQV